jgi:hypothetical protein
MTVLALDWNATRLRAVLAPVGQEPLPIALEPPGIDLPLMIALDKKTPAVGAAALRKCRSAGHEVCAAFLPYLTVPGQGPRWDLGGYSLDAHVACELVWNKMYHLCSNARGIVLTVPDYLRAPQADALRKLAERRRLPLLGSLPAALAAALVGHAQRRWDRAALVVDVDEHALTLGWVKTLSDKAHLVESRSFPHLGLRIWTDRLLNGLADLFVLEHRRDPRDAPLAEQGLFDQLDVLADAGLARRAVPITAQGREWCKHLLVVPEQSEAFCLPLIGKTVQEVEHLLAGCSGADWPPSILLTHAAGRLPGLVDALQALRIVHPSAETKLPQIKATAFDDADFGENLLIHDAEPRLDVQVLNAEAPAQGAHLLADAFRQGALRPGHVETIVPLRQPAAPKIAGSRQPAAS